jgi:hypothetical protein
LLLALKIQFFDLAYLKLKDFFVGTFQLGDKWSVLTEMGRSLQQSASPNPFSLPPQL